MVCRSILRLIEYVGVMMGSRQDGRLCQELV